MGKASLLDERVEDLRVKEHLEERPFTGAAALQEELLIEELGRLTGAIRRSMEKRCEATPGYRE